MLMQGVRMRIVRNEGVAVGDFGLAVVFDEHGGRFAGKASGPLLRLRPSRPSGPGTWRARVLATRALKTQLDTGEGGYPTFYILDEPSIGLHQRDNRRLIDTLTTLRDLGNTVLIVEHDRSTIEAAEAGTCNNSF
jgi:hypothetical protein